MTLKHLFTAAAIAAITLTASAQQPRECPAQKNNFKKGMNSMRPMLSKEAKAKIDAIVKEDLAKMREKMENIKKLADAYKTSKTDENKAKLMDEINKCIDERIAFMEKSLADFKANKAKNAEAMFTRLTTEKQPRAKANRKPRGPKQQPKK